MGGVFIRVWCVCVCVCTTTAVRFPSFSDMQQRAFTNPHCRTEQAWRCILMSQVERHIDSEGRERERQSCCNTEMLRARDESRGSPSTPTAVLILSPSGFVFTSAVGLSALPGRLGNSSSVYTKGFSFPGFPLLKEGGAGPVEAGGCRQSGGAAEALGSVLITVLTASKNGGCVM